MNYSCFAQNSETSSDSIAKASAAQSKPQPKKEFVFKPTIGLGAGLFSFYGDLYGNHFQNPSVSRIAYELNVAQRMTDYLQFNFNVIFGQLGANERNVGEGRNLNFNSHIRAGGINLLYNFGNFLPKDRWASPYISLGIESFEFLSKTDLYDAEGNRYHYWADGTIRNLPENDLNAMNAIELHRDYTYESDIRSMNLDGFGKYSERSWAVPVGAGALMKINDYWTFKIGATMHFTFTDYIDGVTGKSVDNRTGNSKNDNFMMTSFSLHYNLGTKKKALDTVDEETFSDVDFFALDLEDFDKDGVTDSKDSCQGTPEGMPVDAKGCPLDDDSDGVPNNQDDEPSTPQGALVDTRGVTLNDSTIAYQYSFYTDSTGQFAKVEYHDHNGNPRNNVLQKEYTVEIGEFKKGLPPETMTKFLSINDISSSLVDDSTTVYTAGKFPDLLSAEKRKQELVSQGLTDAKVVYKQNGKYYDAPKYGSSTEKGIAGNKSGSNDPSGNKNNDPIKNNDPQTGNNGNSGNKGNDTNSNSNNDPLANNNSNPDKTGNKSNPVKTNPENNNDQKGNPEGAIAGNQKGVVLRVQLGAYRNRLSKKVFKDIGDLIEIKTEDGLYKYLTGSFTDFDAAARHKVEMLLKGYNGAFIAAYKDGKRISLTEAGATMPKKGEENEISDSSAVNGANKNLVIFKVQVGVFKNEPPADKKVMFNSINGLSKEVTSAGLTRYVAGSFPDYKSAEAMKASLIKSGVTDAFVIAFFNGEYITIQEAIELSK
ncbi:MAG: hypothetical protein K0Q95_2902 [Bacteroidota bacterium]|nr:hypothetical protein [Bacteroidota bacterium]